MALPSVEEVDEQASGWLYIHVATSTTVAPMRKVGVIWNPNSTTDARKDRTIDKLVAKPLRMLSEYLMTTAVTSPPKTCTATVAQAQPPKLRNMLMKMLCVEYGFANP